MVEFKSESESVWGLVTSVKKQEQSRRVGRRLPSIPGEMISESGRLTRKSRGFRRFFSPRRPRHHRTSIRISGLFEDPPTTDLSSLLEV